MIQVLKSHPGTLARRVLQRGQAIHAEVCHELDLTTMQSSTLIVLYRQGPLHQRDLSQAIDMELSNLNGLIKRLVDKKLIRQTVDPHDSRAKIVSLTAKGNAFAVQLIPLSTEITDRLLAPLSKAESKQFINLLERVAAG